MSTWLDDAEAQLEVEADQRQAIEGATDWKPEAGDVLKGTLMEGKYILTKFGWTHLINVMLQDGEVKTVWCGSKMLKDQLMTQHPAIGKGLAIKYNGKKQGKDYEYHDYVLSCEPVEGDTAEIRDEQRKERAAYWRAVQESAGEVPEVEEHTATSSEQAGLEDPF
jgi:hypothetical protein